MQRIQDVANIYGGIAGAMPGAPTQQFQPVPWVTGIGGGLSAGEIMGMFGSQKQGPQVASNNPWRTDLAKTIGQRGPLGID